MSHRTQYIEPLIRLIEINEDPTWLSSFQGLRSGGFLPGGGAGSLNDWGPYFADQIKSDWYSILYDILRHLFDNDLPPKNIDTYKAIRLRNNIQIIRCLSCNKSYQHPSSFERHIALEYFLKNFKNLADRQLLLNLFIPEMTYNSLDVSKYRNWLTGQYAFNSIQIYDFVTAKYICPHCHKVHAATEHDLYIVNYAVEHSTFQLVKQNADWNDFETIATF